MAILLFFAFISGLVTILAPCIWPLLPIILSSSATGGSRKPFGITLGIMLSFALFTLTISYLVMLFHFDPNVLRLFAVIVIGFLGLTLVVPSLSQLLEGYVSRLSSKFAGGSNQKNGFSGGFITGFSLGIVWSPCAGPILATIATLAATRAVNIEIILVTLVYVIGVGIPLFIFSSLGSHFFNKTRFLSKYTPRIQQVFGVIMILTALAIYTNYDKVLQAKLLDVFPSYSTFLYKLESSQAVQKQLDSLKNIKKEMETPQQPSSLPNLGKAPEFAGITNWLNTPSPVSLIQLRGKVVLIDFWTYTCINCIRTLPHVTSWYEKYKDKGFVIVGVHTPEFEFEKKTANVQDAIKRHSITYPVAQDNNFATWNAYNNRYWPAKYLIDAQGTIRYVHFGEGKYEETEKAIQTLLKEAGSEVKSNLEEKPDETPKSRLTRETYLGSKRMEFLYPNGTTQNGKQLFTLPQNQYPDTFSFGGEWTVTDESSVSGKNATLVYNFTAQKVFLVLRPGSTASKIKVVLDGKVVDASNQGADVVNGIVTIDTDRLYNLIDLKGKVEQHILRLEFQTEGVSAFAFTFG